MRLSVYVHSDVHSTTFYRVHLKFDQRSSSRRPHYLISIGSKRFQNHQANEHMSNGVWLFLDMLHLIILLAKWTSAKRDVLTFWFQEAKVFLMRMVV